MEDIRNNAQIDEKELVSREEESSSFDIRTIFAIIVLNWQWFLLSMIIFVSGALIYLRYATPTYQMSLKMLIKEEQSNRRGANSLANMQDLGFITNSAGIENEMEILTSKRLALDAVKDLKLYNEYSTKGRVKEQIMYKTQYVDVDLDPASLDSLRIPIELKIERKDDTYYLSDREMPEPFEASFKSLPATVKTNYGSFTITVNPYNLQGMANGQTMYVKITQPKFKAAQYAATLSVAPTSKMTSIAQLVITDQDPERAADYLKQLAICYNRQANADKNEIAYKTETFINSRLEKINAELGLTEGELESYKKRNNITQLRIDATQVLTQSNRYTEELAKANTQLQLLDYLREYVTEPQNKYQIIPSNIGLTDGVSSSLIAAYNQNVQDRNRMLEGVSLNSPQVLTITNTLDRLQASINDALMQARKAADIQRQGIEDQYNIYQEKVANTPEQERILTQIGRQQEVKSGLYLMLLQKREENSISLAATADKGRVIDEPSFGGKVSPKNNIILLASLVLGFALPLLIFYLLQFLRYKIEGHEDVARLTTLPIVADVAVANESAKTAAGIVVHENKNNQTDEIFRSMRTNIQFMMTEGQKVILFTSSTSGEGKTFNASNLAVSFALLGKKTILVGLDIRKPALGRLFNIADRSKGITSLLVKDNITMSDLANQIVESGINNNLDLLLAGPTPPNPTELLARESLKEIIDLLYQKYDYIILDTAPVGLVSDTLQIGKYADVTAFVCRADYTPKTSFALINTLASEQKLKNMCIVLNGVDMSKKKYGYYYGYGKYGKYGRYGYGYGYGRYGYGRYGYGSYGNLGAYGNYADSHYGNKSDDSIKK
ncbi:MAG: polysaccharide biosynthesis tyrosine autokinase [Prevotella sp.]|nr:polysaccharide biosynthesis tyrosine autokinase [Prevotella sp.]